MNLIYTIAYGDAIFFEMAQEMIDSARRVGYAGEIAVLTDKPWSFTGATACPIPMNENDLWRAALPKALNPADYESILFIDPDCILINLPDPLFASDRISIAGSFLALRRAPPTNFFFTSEEKLKHGNVNAICSGIFSFPGSMGLEFFSKWEERWRSFDKNAAPDIWRGRGNHQLWDECALFTLCLRGEIQWDYMPTSSVCFPVTVPSPGNPITQDTILVHFLSTTVRRKSRSDTLMAMRAFVNSGSAARSQALSQNDLKWTHHNIAHGLKL